MRRGTESAVWRTPYGDPHTDAPFNSLAGGLEDRLVVGHLALFRDRQ
jgi:hypothetical protein